MPHVKFTAPVDADVGKIWETLAAFGHISEWHPDIRHSEIVNSIEEGTPGAIRYLDMSDGTTIREELLLLDGHNMTLSYRFTDSPLPWSNYVCTIKVTSCSDAPSPTVTSSVSWSARFDVKVSGTELANEMLLRRMIMTSYHGLKSYLAVDGISE